MTGRTKKRLRSFVVHVVLTLGLVAVSRWVMVTWGAVPLYFALVGLASFAAGGCFGSYFTYHALQDSFDKEAVRLGKGVAKHLMEKGLLQ